MKLFLITLFFSLTVLFSNNIVSQPITDHVTVLQKVVIDGDTFPMYTFKAITINSSKRFSRGHKRRYGRLKRYVIKVFPYA